MDFFIFFLAGKKPYCIRSSTNKIQQTNFNRILSDKIQARISLHNTTPLSLAIQLPPQHTPEQPNPP